MVTTQELQAKFNIAFAKIMEHTPSELRAKWDGNIEWKDMKSFPSIPADILKEMPAGAKAAYISLLNKLSRGNI